MGAKRDSIENLVGKVQRQTKALLEKKEHGGLTPGGVGVVLFG